MLPAGLGARPAVARGVAPRLHETVGGAQRVDPRAALDELLEDVSSLGGRERARFALRPHGAWVTSIPARAIDSSARRQSSIFSPSGTSTGSRPTAVRCSPEPEGRARAQRAARPGAARARE